MAHSLRFVSIALVPLVVLALGTAVWAQPGPGGGPGPGRFGPGFGMPGGGAGASPSAQYERLLNAPTVQKELTLTDDQKTKIKDVADKARAGMGNWFSGMRDWSAEERKAKMEDMGKKMQAQAQQTKKAIEDALSPKQLERLKGIALQVLGVQALNDKEVQRDLKLENFQTAAIRVIGERSSRKIRELFTAGEDRESIGPKIEEARKNAEKQMMDVLTDDQKALLEKMKGDKLEIPAAELPGFGGPRGSRGPGGPGGPGGSGGPGKDRE